MPGQLTAAQICDLARQVSRTPGFREQSGQLLNSILSDICQNYDLDAARKVMNFTFTGATAPIGNLYVQLASGPFPMPVDYLRARRGDILYWPAGGFQNVPGSIGLGTYPLKLIPIDLSEFDGLVQQEGFNNFPVYFATDMSPAQIVLSTSGAISVNTSALSITDGTGVVIAGMSVAGPGLTPGTMVDAVSGGNASTTGDLNSSTSITNVASLSGIVAGQSVTGAGIPDGTTVTVVTPPSTLTISQAATVTNTGVSLVFTGMLVTLTQDAIASVSGGGYMFGTGPNAYVWPPAAGAYPCMVRYQSQMPPIPSAEVSAAIPWFPNQGYLRKKLSAALFELSNDDRFGPYSREADEDLRLFLVSKDDDSDRAKRVTLDPRRFGPAWSQLPPSKIFGY